MSEWELMRLYQELTECREMLAWSVTLFVIFRGADDRSEAYAATVDAGAGEAASVWEVVSGGSGPDGGG